MTNAPIFRIHPSIGLSRVGNSESDEYYLAPESIAGLPRRDEPTSATTGGLPIKKDTEHELITSSDLRGADCGLKRQAARFRIYQYPESAIGRYPAPDAIEVTIGSEVDGRTVTDILWNVHVANKKAAGFQSDDDRGVHAYEHGQTPTLRNLLEGLDPYNRLRLRKLVIDPGPRAIRGTDIGVVEFRQSADHPACHVEGDRITTIHDYPKTFPDMFFENLEAHPSTIDSLGELRTDEQGRLIVTGGHGKSAGWHRQPPDSDESGTKDDRCVPPDADKVPLAGPVNNDQWFDDTSDGPVSATLVFDDGSIAEVHGAWVITTDPSYAPQTLNVVSLWDEAYDVFVRHLDLEPQICRGGAFDDDFHPSFENHVHPFFTAASQQQWNTYLPEIAIDAHRQIGEITKDCAPEETIMAGLAFIRQPDAGEAHTWQSKPSDVGAPLMPLALGDSSESGGKSFLTPTITQYFFLERWADGRCADDDGPPLGDGEYLDRASLQNCLGGRFSPGIDIGFVIREPEMYEDWTRGGGPFRIKHQPLDYSRYRDQPFGPFLSLGWLPRHPEVMNDGLQPGDLSKFLALPWHADYNSCAIHQTSPNTLNSNSLYWSWPGQRPVTVYVAKDYDPGNGGVLPPQRYSVRGPGTMPGVAAPYDEADMANAGRFWDYRDMLDHWHEIGTVVQATIIDDESDDSYSYSEGDPCDVYLEVQSQLRDDDPDAPDQAEPHPWPLIAGCGTARKATGTGK